MLCHAMPRYGAKGHVSHAILAKANLDETRATVGAHNPAADRLKLLSSAGSALAYAAADHGKFKKIAAALPAMIKDAADEVAA